MYSPSSPARILVEPYHARISAGNRPLDRHCLRPATRWSTSESDLNVYYVPGRRPVCPWVSLVTDRPACIHTPHQRVHACTCATSRADTVYSPYAPWRRAARTLAGSAGRGRRALLGSLPVEPGGMVAAGAGLTEGNDGARGLGSASALSSPPGAPKQIPASTSSTATMRPSTSMASAGTWTHAARPARSACASIVRTASVRRWSDAGKGAKNVHA